ncbi:MAG TPA: porin [Methylibium sp.]
MKKSLLALAVLSAFAGAASAQSSVTLYGRVDVALGKAPFDNDKQEANGSGSRVGLRGVEDLGGGLAAVFDIQHRFNAQNGAQTATRFWHGLSVVGLKGDFGQVLLGRNYTASYTYGQVAADPWGGDTVVSGNYMKTTRTPAAPTGFTSDRGTNAILLGGIGATRNDQSITYSFSQSGFTFAAQLAESDPAIAPGFGSSSNNAPFANKPFNFALAYNAGPIAAGVSHERPGADGAKWSTGYFSYNLDVVKLGAFFGSGTNGNNAGYMKGGNVRSWMVTATAPLGGGEARAAYGQRKEGDVRDVRLGAIGYHYPLSKRTKLYTDAIKNGGAGTPTDKWGYDFGLQHNF